MINYKAMQIPAPAGKKPGKPGDCNVGRMSMGSWHADGHKEGKSRKLYKTRELSTIKAGIETAKKGKK